MVELKIENNNDQDFYSKNPSESIMSEKAQSLLKKVVTPIAAFNLIINVLFGTGPIYLPGPMLETGWLMAVIMLGVITFISWICAEYVVEAMSNYNAIEQKLKIDNGNVEEQIRLEDEDPLTPTKTEDSQSYITTITPPEEDLFKLRTVAEFGQMSQMLFGKIGNIICTIILTIYLCGVLISKVIVSSNILSEMFNQMRTGGIVVLDSYYTWLTLFCLVSTFLSFKDIGGIKIVQTITVIIRFTVIGLLILGPVITLMIQGSEFGLTPSYEGVKYGDFHFAGFQSFFSTGIFAMLCHHSIPSIMSNVQKPKDIKKVSSSAFTVGFVMITLIAVPGIAVFGGNMLVPDHKEIYTENFEHGNVWFKIIYYISSFYMFLNIAAFPILIITIRNNIMKCFFPTKIHKNAWVMTKHTVIITISLITPIVLLSIVAKDNIEDVIGVIGGIFGVFLMILIPSFLIINTRKRLRQLDIDVTKNPHRSLFTNSILPWVMFVIGWACLIFNIYQDIKKWTS